MENTESNGSDEKHDAQTPYGAGADEEENHENKKKEGKKKGSVQRYGYREQHTHATARHICRRKEGFM